MTPGTLYHIYSHANGFENLFRTHENYRWFLTRFLHFIDPVGETFAYCLMPNHIHFLIRLKNEKEVSESFGDFESFEKLQARFSKQFANLFSSYTQGFNKMFGRRGSLFIPNFKRREITDEYDFMNVAVYIHRNPVHHNFTNDFQSWPWSSYKILLDNGPTFLKRDEIFQWFGSRERFIERHQL